MDSVAFWLEKYLQLDEVIATPEQINKWNQQTCHRLSDLVLDITQYPAYISSDAIRHMVLENEFPKEPRYIEGRLVTPDYYTCLQQTMNIESLQGIVAVSYGFTLRRAHIRTFPTHDFITKDPEDREFDLFQETALNPAEPLICLHQSIDGEWQYVQTGNYRGWIDTNAIAFSKDRSLWINYCQAPNFLVVTGNVLTLAEDPHMPEFSGLVFAMGAKIPLVESDAVPELIGHRKPSSCHVVWLPVRDQEGTLDFRPAIVAKSADVCKGYLPFSRANLLIQMFKMQGDRYGWGGLFGSRDCSALVQDVFRSFGIFLARNVGEQALGTGRRISFANKSPDKRAAILRSLPPGSTLHFPGHVMLYLGEHDDQFYVFHAIAACGNPTRPQPDGTFARLPLNGIMVTDLSLPRVNGKSLFESLTVANCIP